MSKAHVSAAMIMTAGLGTRLHPFTQVQTKALMPVLGIPSAQYLIDTLVAAGVDRIVANIHHLPQSTRQGLLSLDYSESSLVISDESTELLGTAGGIRKAISLVGQGPILRANADVICNIDWQSLIDRHLFLRKTQGVSLTMALLKNSSTSESYPEILLNSDQSLVTGLGKSVPGGVFWSGAAILEMEALAQVPQEGPSEFVPSILMPALGDQKVGAVLMDSCWFDIGSPQLWLKAHLDLLHLLETQDPRSLLLPKWKERLLKKNFQIQPGVWADRQIHFAGEKKVSAPTYLGSLSDLGHLGAEVGPRCVVYGGEVPQALLKNGIGYSRFWVGVDE